MQNWTRGRRTRAAIDRGELPLGRAYRPTPDERLIREIVLQLKRGAIRPATSRDKFGVDVRARFADAWRLARATTATSRRPRRDRIALTREGLLRVDMLLQRFFLPQHVGVRYT